MDLVHDQNVEINAVSRTSPEYVVMAPKLKFKTYHWSVQSKQLFSGRERS